MISRAPQVNEMDLLNEAAEVLKTLAHPHRLHMVRMMLARECSVGELAESCQIASHAASEHLRLLRDRGMLRKEREGHKVFYRVTDERTVSIAKFVDQYFPTPATEASAV